MRDAAGVAEATKHVVAMGVNCTPPRFVESLLREAGEGTKKPLLCYPNSGESWDADNHCWLPGTGVTEFGGPARLWANAGAKLLGGCCRTGPLEIKEIRKALVP
jgi:homocysteine S-methyltransferase